MAEVTISINGRSYDIDCDNGQEERVADLAAYINQKSTQISVGGAAQNDAHLLVLTALVLADELFDVRGGDASTVGTSKTDDKMSPVEEKALLEAIRTITDRVDGIATKVEAA